MRTSKEFTNNLKNNIITVEMLEQVLYSINKRAKNCRDKKNEYYQKGKSNRYNTYAFNTVDKYKEKEQEYYDQKDFLITSLLNPICVHKEVIKIPKKIRYYDYEPEFDELQSKAIYSSEYYDREECEYVEFIDVIEEHTRENYYKFYETPNCSFHMPITKHIADASNLAIIELNNFKTEGKDILELLSVQFCNKVIELVEADEFQFIEH